MPGYEDSRPKVDDDLIEHYAEEMGRGAWAQTEPEL